MPALDVFCTPLKLKDNFGSSSDSNFCGSGVGNNNWLTPPRIRANPIFFVNPKIIYKSENKSTYEEGCLSVPGQFAEINRPEICNVKYLDYYGQPKEIKAEGMLATCIQHEMDHLEGILFIDYLSKLKKSMIVKKLSKQQKALERIVV